MKKILNIVTSVQTVSEKKSNYILLTANNSVTDDVWDVLRCTDSIYELGAFEIARENQTQFSFSQNPGFDIEQVKSLVVAGAYVATVYKNFNTFIATSLTTHIAYIQNRSLVTFEGRLDLEIVEYVLTAWAQVKALIYSYNIYVDKISRCGINNEKFTQDRVITARNAYNRLFYAKPEDHGISAIQKRDNLTTIQRLVKVLEDDHNQMCEISSRTKNARSGGVKAYESFKDAVDSMSFDAFGNMWLGLTKVIDELNNELTSIETENDFKNGGIVLRQILELAPANK